MQSIPTSKYGVTTSENLHLQVPIWTADSPMQSFLWIGKNEWPNFQVWRSDSQQLTQQILNFHWQLPLLNLPVSWTKSVSQLPGLEKQLSTTYVSKRGFWLATPMCEDSYSQTNISFPTSKIGKTTPNNLRLKIRIPLATSKSPP
jgi:hypothetical protein